MAYPEGGGERSRTPWGWGKALTWWLVLVGIGLASLRRHEELFARAARRVLSCGRRATILMAVKDLARLETNELHLEKVIDLTDKQSRFFGLVDTTDAILLIAAGDVDRGDRSRQAFGG